MNSHVGHSRVEGTLLSIAVVVEPYNTHNRTSHRSIDIDISLNGAIGKWCIKSIVRAWSYLKRLRDALIEFWTIIRQGIWKPNSVCARSRDVKRYRTIWTSRLGIQRDIASFWVNADRNIRRWCKASATTLRVRRTTANCNKDCSSSRNGLETTWSPTRPTGSNGFGWCNSFNNSSGNCGWGVSFGRIVHNVVGGNDNVGYGPISIRICLRRCNFSVGTAVHNSDSDIR
mmetsp:Transcript_4028/g.5970  ORF Transcript_4028/g.5970 Transcript_4028/m.5970 type:complete len:229 (+) Transcript_4028:670-1356(+)